MTNILLQDSVGAQEKGGVSARTGGSRYNLQDAAW